jgi:hypothetical protein
MVKKLIVKSNAFEKTPIVTSAGNRIYQKKYNGKFTRKQIENQVQNFSNKLKGKLNDAPGLVTAAINYPIGGWRHGTLTSFGNRIQLYDFTYDDNLEEPDTFDGFVIYFQMRPKNAGGKDVHNDCLHKALRISLQDKMPASWKYASKLKKFLGLQRNDLVSIDHIPAIEEKLKKYKINVTGDYVYTSTIDSKFEINLKLVNEHFKLDTSKAIKQFVAFEEKKHILFVKKLNKTNEVETYDGKTTEIISSDKYNATRKELKYGDWLICESNTKLNYSLLQEYNEFIETANRLKKETKGLINLFKFGNKASVVAKSIFDLFTKTIVAEPIKQDEAEWLEKARQGALVWVTNEYNGEAYEYDFNSFYPSIQSNRRSKFPFKRGEFKRMQKEEFNNLDYYQYGIYRANVTNPNSIPNIKKLFKFNKENYYTYIDLTVAKRLNLNIELIEDSNPNALIYGTDSLVSGRQLFGKFVDYMFALKKSKVPFAKDILNVLWGALCEKRTIALRATIGNEDVIIHEGKTIQGIVPYNDNTTKVIIFQNEMTYQTNYARIKPFILARGRERIGTQMEPHLEHIIRCHTDGFLSLKSLDITTGNEMGDLQFKGKIQVQVHSNLRIERLSSK